MPALGPTPPEAAAAPAGLGGRVAAAATVVALLAATSAALGLVRDVVIGAVFGASAQVDAYLVAQGFMNLVLGLAAGSLAKAVVPVVAPAVAAGDARAAHRSVFGALCVALVVLGTAAIVLGLLAGPLVNLLAPGFDPATASLAEGLTRIVLAATVLIAATNVFAAVAQSHRRFFWSSSEGIVFNLVMILAAGLFGPRYGIWAVAVGYVVASAARLLLQILPLWQLRVRLAPVLDPRDPGLRTIARLVPPLLVASAVGNINTLVDRAVASVHGEGTIAALSYGWRVATLADTLVVASLITALYPAFGAVAAPATRAALRNLVSGALGGVTLVLVPVVATLLVAAPAAVALIYQRGSFGADAVALTATAVAWYAPGLLPLAWQEVVTRAFYALGDTRTPVAVALLAVGVNVAGDLTLGLRFGVPGLAASTVLSLVVASVANGVILSRRYQALDVGRVAASIGRLGLAGVAAITAAAASLPLAGAVLGADPAGGLASLLRLGSAAGGATLAYAIVLAVLSAPEGAAFIGLARRAGVSLRRGRGAGRSR